MVARTEKDTQQIGKCPQCGQILAVGPASKGKTLYCPECDSPVCLAPSRADTSGDRSPPLFVQLVGASLLAIPLAGLSILGVAAVAGLLLELLMPGSAWEALFGSTLFLLVFGFPFWVPAAMIIGVVTQAVSDKSKLHVLRIFVVCAVIPILAVALLMALAVTHAH